ncbi:MAG: UvrD-helicase domain-containing protein [Microthrixaceae bacterium]
MSEPQVPRDQAERTAIESGPRETTLFVDAGAGSGKTHGLVERIAHLVLECDVPVTAIAAITFTEAAAAELRERIRLRLNRAVVEATATGVAATATAARQELADLDQASISTLHSFAARLLGEFGIEIGLPPELSVLDEVSSRLAAEQRWDTFVAGLYQDPDLDELLYRAAVLGIRIHRAPGSAKSLRSIAEQLTQSWDRIDPLCDAAPPAITEPATDSLDRVLADLSAMLDQGPPAGSGDALADACHDYLARVRELRTMDDPLERVLAVCGAPVPKRNVGKRSGWHQEVKDFIRDVLAPELDDCRSRATEPYLQHLMWLTARHVRSEARRRQAEGTLEFHDLLVLARELLRTSRRARSTLAERYQVIMLDEFQDTDPIQIEIATLIASSAPRTTTIFEHPSPEGTVPDGTTGPAAHADDEPPRWEDVEVAPGRLFFVGDPKQSIYRFRRADVDLFRRARATFGTPEGLRTLTTNFRSVPEILAWVNHCFTGLIDDYQPLDAYRSSSGSADHRPLLVGGPHDGATAAELRAAEADDVAGVIRDIVGNPGDWPVSTSSGGDGPTWRPPTLSDIAVLIPTRTSLPTLRAALDESDIAYRLGTGTLVYHTQEVRDALSALAAIDDPDDSIHLIAALRSPLYACSDVDLAEFRAAGGSWDYRVRWADRLDPVPPGAQPTGEVVVAAMEDLHRRHHDRVWDGPATVLGALLDERGAALLAFGDPHPSDVWHRLRYLRDQARAFEEADGGDLRAFLRWAELQSEDGSRVHEPMLATTDEDAVLISTIHGAKGLEFPVTILAGMTTRGSKPREGYRVLFGDGDDQVPVVKVRPGVASGDFDVRADLESQMDAEEKVRLLYVGATRARDHLVVSCHHRAPKPSAGPAAPATLSHAQRIWQVSGDDRHFTRRWEPTPRGHSDGETTTVVGNEFGTVSPDSAGFRRERDAWVDRRRDLLARVERPAVFAATAIGRAGTASPPPDGEVEARSLLDPDLVDGTALGRAVHRTLELVDLADPDGNTLRAVAATAARTEGIEGHLSHVLDCCVAALAAPSVRLAATRPHHKEHYLAAPIGGVVVEGYVDLLVETDDGLLIVDYKSDDLRDPIGTAADAAAARYRLQAATYAAALSITTGLPIAGAAFVFCGTQPALERYVGDLDTAMAEVEQAVKTR